MITSSTSAACTPASFDGVLNSMATEGGAMGHIEGTLPAFGKGSASGRNNHSFTHGDLSLFVDCLPEGKPVAPFGTGL